MVMQLLISTPYPFLNFEHFNVDGCVCSGKFKGNYSLQYPPPPSKFPLSIDTACVCLTFRMYSFGSLLKR